MSEEQNEIFFSCEIADLCIKLQCVKNRLFSQYKTVGFFCHFPSTRLFFFCGYLLGAVPFDLQSEALVHSWRHVD